MALERDRGKLNEAIGLLNKYLENNQQDTEAWIELTDIYLSRHNYEKAQFCYEEILSMQPTNYLVNIKYAEILYSIGTGNENLENLYNARKYYSHALTLQSEKAAETETRALWGLLQTCKAIEPLLKKEDEKNTEIILTCKDRIREIYEKKTGRKFNINGMKLMS